MKRRIRRRTLVAGLAGGGVVAIAGCLGESDVDESTGADEAGDTDDEADDADEADDPGEAQAAWAMYGNDARNTFVADHDGPGSDPEIAWSKPIADGISRSIAPIVHDGTVYVPDARFDSDADLLAIEVADGDREWGWDLDGQAGRGASVAIADGTLYAATTEVMRLDPDAEAIDWRVGDDLISPTDFLCLGSGIAVYSSQSTLVAVDIDEETVHWERELEGRPEPPAIDDDHVYIGSRSAGSLVALSIDDGELRWELDAVSGGRSGVAVDGDHVYFGEGFDAVAVDRMTGEEQWRERMGGTVARPPAIGEGAVYYPGTGRIASYARSDGTVDWAWDVDGGLSTGVLTPEMFYTGTTDGTLLAIDRDEETIAWELDVGEGIDDAPAIADDTLYVVGDGELYAIR